jgi:acetyl esterase/lipase
MAGATRAAAGLMAIQTTNQSDQMPANRSTYGWGRGSWYLAVRLGLLLVSCSGLSGCLSMTLFAANAPSMFGDYQVERNISYGPHEANRLDVYRPATKVTGSAAPRPVVVFLHGGGWVAGSKNQYRFVAEALVSRGYVAVLPAYRLYPEASFPGFVEDAAQALAWVHRCAAKIGGDPDRIFVMGHSAGAHIGSLLTFDEHYLAAVGGNSSWIRGFVGLAGPYDFLPLREAYVKAVFAPRNYYDSQTINFIDGKEPPALLLHGLDDHKVWPSNSRSLAMFIRGHGGRVEEHYYEGMTHGGIVAGMTKYFRNRRPVLNQIDQFIKAQSELNAAAR